MNEPWDKLPEETLKAYIAFNEYLKLGYKRSLDKVAFKLGMKSTKSIERYSKLYRWKERAEAYTIHMLNESHKTVRFAVIETIKNYLTIFDLPAIAIVKKLYANQKELEGMSIEKLFNLASKAANHIPSLVELQDSLIDRINHIHNPTEIEDDDVIERLSNDPQIKAIIEQIKINWETDSERISHLDGEIDS